MNENLEKGLSEISYLTEMLKKHEAMLNSCLVPDGVKPFNIPVEKQYVARDSLLAIEACTGLLDNRLRYMEIESKKPRTLWQKLFRK